MSPFASKQELLDFQDRWLRPVGMAALLGAFATAAAILLGRLGLHIPGGDSNADQLAFIHAHSSRLMLSAIIQAIAFILFLAPVFFLFRSARDRSERVRRQFIGLVLLGPLALGVGLVISAIGGSDIADKFVKQAPAAEQRARNEAQSSASVQAKQAPKQGASGKSEPTATSTTTTGATTATTSATTTTAGGTTTTASKPETPDQAASDARENLADDLKKDSTVITVGSLLSVIGALSLAGALVYTSLWSMRTGLLTRAWGMLGVAFGLFLVIPIIPAIPALALWFAVLGLMFVGLWPRPLPPAWSAGEAIPWPGRDDVGPPTGGPPPDGPIEGSGRDVSERPLPEEGPPGPVGAPPGEDQPLGETQGQRRKKRKRRG